MSAYAQRALIVTFPPVPQFTGDAFLLPGHLHPAGKI